MIAHAEPTVHYTLKESPYSSHTLLMNRLPASGRGLRVLDLGCANGALAASVAARGYRVTGVERPGGVTGEFPASVRLVQADLEFGLPDLDSHFDSIVCADVLEHLRDPLRLLRCVTWRPSPADRIAPQHRPSLFPPRRPARPLSEARQRPV